MLIRILQWFVWHLLFACLALGLANALAAQTRSPGRHRARSIKAKKAAKASPAPVTTSEGEVIGKRVKFSDGSSLETDDAWKQGEDLWYRSGGMTRRIDRTVSSVEPIRAAAKNQVAESPAPPAENIPPKVGSLWIFLQGGARMKVDEVTEADSGVWYRRGNLSIFLERERIARIERESSDSKPTGWSDRGWTSGNSRIDELIRTNATRFGLDPYLVFCVVEYESHFHVRAVSPKGALGLMQLMPGTASRLGVRRPFDPAQNIFGGTQYLKELLKMFGGRLDLALASYNAGEGAVLKYGGRVPPYRETRDYVQRISRRYGTDQRKAGEKTSPPR